MKFTLSPFLSTKDFSSSLLLSSSKPSKTGEQMFLFNDLSIRRGGLRGASRRRRRQAWKFFARKQLSIFFFFRKCIQFCEKFRGEQLAFGVLFAPVIRGDEA